MLVAKNFLLLCVAFHAKGTFLGTWNHDFFHPRSRVFFKPTYLNDLVCTPKKIQNVTFFILQIIFILYPSHSRKNKRLLKCIKRNKVKWNVVSGWIKWGKKEVRIETNGHIILRDNIILRMCHPTHLLEVYTDGIRASGNQEKGGETSGSMMPRSEIKNKQLIRRSNTQIVLEREHDIKCIESTASLQWSRKEPRVAGYYTSVAHFEVVFTDTVQ